MACSGTDLLLLYPVSYWEGVSQFSIMYYLAGISLYIFLIKFIIFTGIPTSLNRPTLKAIWQHIAVVRISLVLQSLTQMTPLTKQSVSCRYNLKNL